MRTPALTRREFPGLGRLYFHRTAGVETRFIHNEIVLDGDYLNHGITVGPGDVVFDVGANIGVFSLDIDRRCSGQCTIYAFELLLGVLMRRFYRPRAVSCELTALSEICARHPVPRIDLLKIDVEGAERDVLGGIGDAEWPRIRQIVIEAHDVDGRVAAITSLLRDRGFQVISEQPPWARSAALDNTNFYARRPL